MEKRKARQRAWKIVGWMAYQEALSPTYLTMESLDDWKSDQEWRAMKDALQEIYEHLSSRYGDPSNPK